MALSLPDIRRRMLLAALTGCGVLAGLVPGIAAGVSTAKIEVHAKGRMTWHFNEGTRELENDVELRQAPDTLIRADRARGSNLTDGNMDNGQWTLSGAVHIEFDGSVLDADSAMVEFIDGIIHSIQVEGAPAVFTRPAGNAGEPSQGRGDTITYDGTRRQIRLSGHTEYAFGPYEGKSDKPLVYNLDSTEISSERVPNDDSRITFTFRNIQASARNWRANIHDGTQVLEQDVELRRTPDTLIRADRAEGSNLKDGYDDGLWTLSRKVRIEHEDQQLEADAATVAFAAGDARSIQVRGAPARFSFPAGSDGQRFEGRADSIAFDGAKRHVRVIGHPSHYTFGNNQFNSDKPLLYRLDERVLSSEDRDNPDTGVRGTINPDHVSTPRTPARGKAQ
jgi:lipopolysaccharide export system protein LptA